MTAPLGGRPERRARAGSRSRRPGRRCAACARATPSTSSLMPRSTGRSSERCGSRHADVGSRAAPRRRPARRRAGSRRRSRRRRRSSDARQTSASTVGSASVARAAATASVSAGSAGDLVEPAQRLAHGRERAVAGRLRQHSPMARTVSASSCVRETAVAVASARPAESGARRSTTWRSRSRRVLVDCHLVGELARPARRSATPKSGATSGAGASSSREQPWRSRAAAERRGDAARVGAGLRRHEHEQPRERRRLHAAR